MLTIPADVLDLIIVKAREFDAEVPAPDDGGSNSTDDQEAEILFDTPDNPTERELRDIINELNVDQQTELLALTWLGRGDFEAEDWASAIRTAREAITTNEAGYLMGTPLLGDYLSEGRAALDRLDV